MKVSTVTASDLGGGARLDAKYFAVPAQRIRRAFAHAENTKFVVLGGEEGIAKVSAPARFKRVYAVPGEDFVPYLRPYDVFEFLPMAADELSATRTEHLDSYRIRVGDILQTCSGRNLGPCVIADEYLAQFALSHDMIRVRIANEQLRFYVFAFMQSRTGQYLLRGDLSGSVIDHITVEHVNRLAVPIFEDLLESTSDAYARAFKLREGARVTLRATVAELEAALEQRDAVPLTGASPRAWTMNASGLGSRIDAAYHDDLVRQSREAVRKNDGIRLSDVAKVIKPGGRYKTYYVDAEHGRPILSGRQLLQGQVVGGKHISERSIARDSGYDLAPGWICFQADGRAEEALGTPVLITSDRAGWLASGHVGRIIADDPTDAGWLWASLATTQLQDQIASLACGSVVDALYPEDLARLILPPRGFVDASQVVNAWEDFALAAQLEAEAIHALELRLAAITGAVGESSTA